MRTRPVLPTPANLLWNYSNGRMPDFLNKSEGPVGWVKWSHRGIQPLDDIQFPDSQKRYIHSKKFTLKFNTAFEEVVRATADPTRFGKTWITPELITGLIALHKTGHAHSFEAWSLDGQLAGGIWGIQIGSFITASSMFIRQPNATKFAYGQTLLHLKSRGFTLVDTGMVPDHNVNYGSRYIPSWQFDQLLKPLLHQPRTIADNLPVPLPPSSYKLTLPAVRLTTALFRRLGFSRN